MGKINKDTSLITLFETNFNEEQIQLKKFDNVSIFFTGNRLKAPYVKPFACDQILQICNEKNSLKNLSMIDNLVTSIDQNFKSFSFKMIPFGKDCPKFLISNTLNVFIRGEKGKGKSTLALGILNRLLAKNKENNNLDCPTGNFKKFINFISSIYRT